MEDSAEEADVLKGQRDVEAEGMAERLDLLRGRLGRQHEPHGISGEIEEGEDDEGHRHDDAEGLDEAPEDVGRHRDAVSRRAD